MFIQVMWVVLGVVIVVSALRAPRHAGALKIGVSAVGVLYLAAGALVNAVYLMQGDDYQRFADGSYIPFVRDTWRSFIVPNHHLFIGALVVFEATVGILAFAGGRRAQLALVAAIAFHVALLSFGWGFYLWAVPMIGSLSLLLRVSLREQPRLERHGRRAQGPTTQVPTTL